MIATTIEQSRKLAEILPAESADMWYWEFPTAPKYNRYDHPMFHKGEGITNVPAWSLSALLELIPSHIDKVDTFLRLRMDKDEENFNIWYEDYGTGLCIEDSDIIKNTPIDALFEMIVWLKENKYI